MVALQDAADGRLARVRVPGGRLTAEAMVTLAAAADELGNGLLDVTARANLQLRGLRAGAEVAGDLAGRLHGAALLPSVAHDRARNVLASPLAGRAPGALGAVGEVDDIVALLDAGICASDALRDLPARFCFLADDGTGAGREIRPDVIVVARGVGHFGVALDGRELDFEGDGPAAVALALGAAEAFVDASGDAWRLSETPGGARTIAAALGLALEPVARAVRTRTFGPGAVSQRDGRIALTGLAPLGQLWPSLLRELARLSPAGVRLSARRTVTLVDLAGSQVAPMRAALAGAGLVLESGSGWVGLTACAGTGACSRALVDVRAAACARALSRSAREPAEHWAACERRCGELPAAPVTVAARAADALEVRYHGEVWDLPSVAAAAARLELEAAR
ncbi:MAG: precorrin-3B synthase [Actinobacteria bacterium]|nr:precorrin-3B synthase [Actinomycetota bacterium]